MHLQTDRAVAQSLPRSSQIAQVPSILTGGNQVVIGGQVTAIPWIQWQADGATYVGISDLHLTQRFGIELLNTTTPELQPVQWFSDPTATPIVLRTRLYQGTRYLDITPLIVQFGWQVQLNGASLQITQLPSQVTEVRQGRHTNGERTVIELSNPTTWQATQDGDTLLLNINARAASPLVSRLQPTPGNLVKDALRHRESPKLTAQSDRTTLRLPIPAATNHRISTLPSPPRIVVDFRPDAMVDRDILWAPGLRWRQQYVAVNSARFPVIWLEIDPRQTGLQLRPIWTTASTMIGLDPVAAMAQRWQAIAAINAGFFSRNTYSPLGAIRRDGVWYSSPILNRGAIAWTNDGAIKIDRLTLNQILSTSTGQQIPLLHADSGYVQAGVSLYTTAWGNVYVPLTDNELIITVVNNQVIQQQPTAIAGGASIPIPPPGGYLLVARSLRSIANKLPVGTIVQLSAATVPNDFQAYPHIIGAGPLLLKNGQAVLDAATEKFSPAFIAEAAVRSAIATLPNGNLVIVTVQNRVKGRGPTLVELTQIMQALGALDALNLDGGSSTTLYLGGQLLNRHPRTAARVHNSIGIFVQP